MTVCAICQREPAVAPLRDGGEGVCGKCVARMASKAGALAAAFAPSARLPPSVDVLDPGSREDFDPREVQETLKEFKPALKIAAPEDVDTRLDLGIAYREMGLGHDAWAEFAIVLEHARGKQLERALNQIFGRDSGYRGDLGALRDLLYPA